MTNNDNLQELRQRMKALQAKKAKKQDKELGKDVSTVVDLYVKLIDERRSIEKSLDSLREQIYSILNNSDKTELCSSEGRRVTLQESYRVKVTGNYTAYDLDDIGELIPEELKYLVIKQVVDRDVLESLVVTGQIPQEVLEAKITSLVTSLIVK